MGRIKSLIRLDFYEVCTYTDEKFEKMAKQIMARFMCGCREEGDRALCQLIYEHYPRYCEVVIKNGREPDPLLKQIAEAYEKNRKRN